MAFNVFYSMVKEYAEELVKKNTSFVHTSDAKLCALLTSSHDIIAGVTSISLYNGSVSTIPAEYMAAVAMNNIGQTKVLRMITISLADFNVVTPNGSELALINSFDPDNVKCEVFVTASESVSIASLIGAELPPEEPAEEAVQEEAVVSPTGPEEQTAEPEMTEAPAIAEVPETTEIPETAEVQESAEIPEEAEIPAEPETNEEAEESPVYMDELLVPEPEKIPEEIAVPTVEEIPVQAEETPVPVEDIPEVTEEASVPADEIPEIPEEMSVPETEDIDISEITMEAPEISPLQEMTIEAPKTEIPGENISVPEAIAEPPKEEPAPSAGDLSGFFSGFGDDDDFGGASVDQADMEKMGFLMNSAPQRPVMEKPVIKADTLAPPAEFSKGINIDESNPFYEPGGSSDGGKDVVYFAEMDKQGEKAADGTPGAAPVSAPKPAEEQLSMEELLKQAKKRKKIAKANFNFRKK